MLRLGVVSFLNARPLIAGLANDPRVECAFAVPAALPALLDDGAVDVALVPVVDLLRRPDTYAVISDACIGCRGETLTVRVFARAPVEDISVLWADPDSHTSVMLARVLWQQRFHRDLEIRPLTHDTRPADDEAVLLIGDKVVSPGWPGATEMVDLGAAWQQHTHLPFVFAVWAARRDRLDRLPPDAADLIAHARDRGLVEAHEIAAAHGPARGWDAKLAEFYLTQCLRFKLDESMVRGAERFARACRSLGLVGERATIRWPEQLTPAHSETAS